MAEMTKKRNRWGVGLQWALPTTVYFVAAVIVHFSAYPRFAIAQLSPTACAGAGVPLILLGACTYAAAFVSLRRGLRKGTLVTHGLYAVTRHPLYASSILLILPGVALVFGSWLLLPMPVVAYVAFRVFLSAEEEDLHKQYGDDFARYRDTTNALFPTLPRWRSASRSAQKRKE